MGLLMYKQKRFDYGKRFQKTKYVDSQNATLCDAVINPVITEKSSIFEMNRILSFTVAKWADKRIIAAAVKFLFNCNVLKVRILHTNGTKKAYITIDGESFNKLKEKSNIEI